jgi:type II restriction/modification system DNA methylase subunit YeeA
VGSGRRSGDLRGTKGTSVALTPQEFVARWERVTLSELASYQQHFLDLCEMLGEPRPAESDASGSSYTFEKRVEKTGGGVGFADVWRRGRFAIEYKRKGGNLTSAYKQLAEYRESLENPPVMIATEADLVTYWFEKARKYIEEGRIKRAGLISTNSIRGGKNREVLKRVKGTSDIFMAYSDREWIQNGAAVRVSMVGFDDGSEMNRFLDGIPADTINSDLTGTLDLASASTLPENRGIAFIGTQKGGSFDILEQLAKEMLDAPGNPNGRPNSDVVKPWINGLDVTRRPRNMWIIDFGTDMLEDEAALYEAPFEYAVEYVKNYRMTTKSEARTGEIWWLHQRPRPEMRRAIEPLSRFIATARVAKHRLFVWTDLRTIPDSQIVVFARDDDYFLGVLHSRVHELWSLRMGTSLEDRPRYTPTTCFETFPLPWPPGEEPGGDPRVEAIAEAARRLDGLRRNWLDPEGASDSELKKRTLTNLYNARPTWLANAHAVLDRAVFAAYGWPPDIADEDILKELLALNLERSSGEAG